MKSESSSPSLPSVHCLWVIHSFSTESCVKQLHGIFSTCHDLHGLPKGRRSKFRKISKNHDRNSSCFDMPLARLLAGLWPHSVHAPLFTVARDRCVSTHQLNEMWGTNTAVEYNPPLKIPNIRMKLHKSDHLKVDLSFVQFQMSVLSFPLTSMFQSIDIALFCFCRHFHGLCLTSFLSMSTCMPMYELSLSGKKDQKTTTQPFRLEKPSLMSGIPRTPAKLLNMLQHLSNLAPFAWPRLHPVSPLTYQGQQPKGQDKPIGQMWRQRLQRWNLSSFPRNTDLTVKLMLCFVMPTM